MTQLHKVYGRPLVLKPSTTPTLLNFFTQSTGQKSHCVNTAFWLVKLSLIALTVIYSRLL